MFDGLFVFMLSSLSLRNSTECCGRIKFSQLFGTVEEDRWFINERGEIQSYATASALDPTSSAVP